MNGIDLAKIHGDRIVGAFSSPVLDKRMDAYGGSAENRRRFSLAPLRERADVDSLHVCLANHSSPARTIRPAGSQDYGRFLGHAETLREVAEGREGEIRHCRMCKKACADKLMRRKPVACAINAKNGHVAEALPARAARRLAVLVIGAGPAGLEAVRLAAERGPKVTLLERSSRIGGQARLACVPPHKEGPIRLLDYCEAALPRLGSPRG